MSVKKLMDVLFNLNLNNEKENRVKTFFEKIVTSLVLFLFIFGTPAFADDNVYNPNQAFLKVEKIKQATETSWYLKVLDEVNFKVDNFLISALQGRTSENYSINVSVDDRTGRFIVKSKLNIEVPISHVITNLTDDEFKIILDESVNFKPEDKPYILYELNRNHSIFLAYEFENDKKDAFARLTIDNPEVGIPTSLSLAVSGFNKLTIDTFKDLRFLTSIEEYNINHPAPGIPVYMNIPYRKFLNSESDFSKHLDRALSFLEVFNSDLKRSYEKLKSTPKIESIEKLVNEPYKFFKEKLYTSELDLDKVIKFIYTHLQFEDRIISELEINMIEFHLYDSKTDEMKQGTNIYFHMREEFYGSQKSNVLLFSNVRESISLWNIFGFNPLRVSYPKVLYSLNNGKEIGFIGYFVMDMDNDGFITKNDILGKAENYSQLYNIYSMKDYRISWMTQVLKSFLLIILNTKVLTFS